MERVNYSSGAPLEEKIGYSRPTQFVEIELTAIMDEE